jgi:hypothetical protein
MPGKKAPGLKNPELYEELRKQGDSKEKSARISNAAARDGARSVGRRGGESGSYEDWNVADLKRRARELGLTRYSHKTKAQLVSALRSH